MNLYSNKQRWKIILMLIAVLIVGASLWYSSIIVSKIRNDEREKIKLWSTAVKKKAQQVSYSNKLFNQMRVEERKKIELWTQAQSLILQILSMDIDMSLNPAELIVSEVVQANNTIPVIITKRDGKIDLIRNIDPKHESDSAYLYDQLQEMAGKYPPIKLIGYQGFKYNIYHNDSKLIRDLENIFQDLTQSFFSEVVVNSSDVPVILVNNTLDSVITFGNIDTAIVQNKALLKETLNNMGEVNPRIEIVLETFDYVSLIDRPEVLQLVMDSLKARGEQIEILLPEEQTVTVSPDEFGATVVALTRQQFNLNLSDSLIAEEPELLYERIKELASHNEELTVVLRGNKSYVYFEDSFLLTQLKYYPYIQFAIIGLFLLVSYLLFSTFRKAEQNQVWVGMAKETAHQLGTPLSSLMAWVEYLKDKGVDNATITELNKDVRRLEIITDRFSKIGSEPELKSEEVLTLLDNLINYLKTRVSRKVTFAIVNLEEDEVFAQINKPLFEWVIENLCKNAIDAMGGNGDITVEVSEEGQQVIIDISDTGKGIPASKFKTVFEPGFTTKKRGWGLGLSLTKRIMENYHSGKIFVKQSEIDKGTTFRIVLNK